MSRPESITIRDLVIGLVETLLPSRCPACRSVVAEPDGGAFCRACATRIRYITTPLCPRCGLPFASPLAESHLCGVCIEDPPIFSLARAMGRYEGPLREAIHHFKYGADIGIGETIGALMADFPYPGFSVADYDLVVPVPLHVERLRQRGFNQALVLARAVARRHDVPLDFTILQRHKDTPAQVALDRRERSRNVRGAFGVTKPEEVRNKGVLIVDDVYTTGSTAEECARVLSRCGARETAVLTAARVV